MRFVVRVRLPEPRLRAAMRRAAARASVGSSGLGPGGAGMGGGGWIGKLPGTSMLPALLHPVARGGAEAAAETAFGKIDEN